MGRAGTVSNGRDYRGDYYTHAPCTLSFARANKPRVLAVKRSCCGDWRCSKYCKCHSTARPKSATKAAPMQAPKVAPQAAHAPLLATNPVGRLPDVKVDVYYNNPLWWDHCIAEIGQASAVLIGSYQYDDHAFHAALLKRLVHQRINATCEILVDRQCYEERKPAGAYTKLQELKRHGAHVFKCTGGDGKAQYGKMLCLGSSM